MINARFYKVEDKQIWDNFINESKNGTFMLNRDYMDYHSDRFKDFSIMFYDDDKLVSVLPASRHGEEVRSHGGLTYGGMVTNRKMNASKMLEVFDALKVFLKENNVKKLIYKAIPSVYHKYPSDEDLYALFRNDAKLVRRDISTSILLTDKIPFSELRKRGAKKAIKNGLIVKQSDDFDGYIEMLAKILEEYHEAKPVHSGEELSKLASNFPNNIKLFCAFKDEKMVAGVVIFETEQTVHAQYIANSNEGRDLGALDLVMSYLINEYSSLKKYFDFGISTEDGGRYLNNGLINQKEMFGGRGIIYDFYELEI
ncbi:MAG: hypothetical protein BWY78_01218 [Alphaproteobacteria bacterium ADurb.Bin438]|nr:MAG: hypothetical protein BWY78_01218 [Alphaproteobacteria bacterium ADurb.Bin438]